MVSTAGLHSTSCNLLSAVVQDDVAFTFQSSPDHDELSMLVEQQVVQTDWLCLPGMTVYSPCRWIQLTLLVLSIDSS